MPPNNTTPANIDVTPPPPSDVPGANTPPAPAKSGKSSMLPKLMILIGAIIVVVLVVYAFSRPKSKTTSNNSTTSQSTSTVQTADVSIGAFAFNPATLQIKAGTRVTWTNNDTAVHQVAADPYPKDNSIPNFDSTVILEPKDTFSFVFTKTGTYTYHDERHPFDIKGTVLVQ